LTAGWPILYWGLTYYVIISGVGVFFLRQDDRSGSFNKTLATAAWIGKTRLDFWGCGCCMRQAVNCRVVAADRSGRRQPGILPKKKYPDP